MNPSSHDVDFLLSNLQNSQNHSQVIQLLYTELRAIAGRCFKTERADHTLQPTALVNEMYLRLQTNGPKSYENRAHFFAVAARAMRQTLVDYGRHRSSLKAGSGMNCLPLDEFQIPGSPEPDFLVLDDLLNRLKRFDELGSRVVELHIFGGLTFKEIGELLSRGESTVRKDWCDAILWLRRESAR